VQASLGCGNPVAIAGLYPGQVVVDLGSGGGLDVILAARRVGPTGYVYGIDMTPEMLELARVNQSRSGLSNVAFVQGRIEDVPLRDGLADVVISNCVINLAPDKDAVLGECYRVLRPGGVLAVSDTVWIKPPPQSVTASRDSWAQCVAGALPVETYRSKLASAGFGEIDIQVSGGVTWGPAELASAYIRARKPVAPLAPVFRPAAAADENAVRELLSGCGLPLAGLDHTEVIVCELDGVVAATAGLEWHQGEALLRSIAVARQFRSHGLGRRITGEALDRAREKGAGQVFLLTTTARPFFESLGFKVVGREAVALPLQASPELQGACPATAEAMRLQLA
jgi:SAM-dependent methyltransferase/predicted GNAT family acetyltransferase